MGSKSLEGMPKSFVDCDAYIEVENNIINDQVVLNDENPTQKISNIVI